ncbi:MAG: BCCT family transporter [Bacteroidia bacterium]
MEFKGTRPWVFFPPLILLFVAIAASVIESEGFLTVSKAANTWILDNFAGGFSVVAFVMIILCVLTMISPLGKMRIGGKEAKPLLSRWRWFGIILCTTVATGILFWGTAEPLYHLNSPPDFAGAIAGSEAASRFSLSVMFTHWSIAPYAIYAVPALVFALAYYNFGSRFSLSATLNPLLKSDWHGPVGTVIDAVSLFALVAGMAASLGAGILTLSGGLQKLFGLESSVLLLAAICLLIVVTFLISAASGLLKGIRVLSNINVIIFIGLALFVFVFGPTKSILTQAASGLGAYVSNFWELHMSSLTHPESQWPKSWTVFYWANWMAWAPITALFLGRISRGYTVREFLLFNWIIPALFSIAWMSIFSGTTLHMELEGSVALGESLKSQGEESVIYLLLEQLPLLKVILPIFIFTVFLSYVTAADSNTAAMAGISAKGITPENPEPPLFPKIIWGLTIGAMALTMVATAGIDGIKMLSNLGGLPILFLLAFVAIALGKMIWESFRTNRSK